MKSDARITDVVDPGITAGACRSCGACCCYEVAEPTSPDGSCLCLVGKVGAAVRCAAYRERPSLCREYVPGSRGCLESRQAVLRDGWRP
jgi:Fe-S-cluster containining protein